MHRVARRDPYAEMLRGALLPTLAVAGAAVALSAALGARVLVGSALGAALVVTFFGLTLVAMRAARTVAPEMLLGIALALYSTKVAVLGGVAFWLRQEPWLSPTALAATAFTCAVAWLGGQVAGFTRMRVLVADPGPSAER